MFTFRLNRYNYEIDVDEKIFIIEEFKAIWDYDKTKQKKRAKRIFLYIWVGYDISSENDYRELPMERRLEEAMNIAFGKKVVFKEVERNLIQAAVKRYIELSSTAEERLLATVQEHIDEQNKILMNIKSIDENGELVPGYSKKLEATLKNIKELILRKKELEKVIKNDEGKIRGDKQESYLERGDLSVKSKFGRK